MNKTELIELVNNRDNIILVKVRNEKIYAIFNSYLKSENGFLRLSDYREDLTDIDDQKMFDIIEIYEGNYYSCNYLEMFDTKKVIWQREEVVELTLEDISKKFEIPIDKIRIKL